MKRGPAIVLLIAILSVMPLTAFGANGVTGTREVETLLSKLGYWIVKVDGVADESTRHAIMAFQKVEGRKRTGVMTAADLKALRVAQRPLANYPTTTAHIEIDLKRQVLFYVDETGTVARILPISSGNGKRFSDEGQWKVATTPRGLFNVQRKINAVHQSSLGALYYPSYFSGGVAIHGSNSIPAYPDSHGCVRVPRFADQALFRMIKMDMEVYVYD
ncbi:MAG TPA: L,D-transpeptidase family protein [Pyrinomonadaceae bacterium]|nr:L,D-transpeptidase family protein [Pyrinomonadaceae bacterium]